MEILNAVIKTLNQIEVHGKNNLDMLLGCIQTLEQMVSVLKQPDEETSEEMVDDGRCED